MARRDVSRRTQTEVKPGVRDLSKAAQGGGREPLTEVVDPARNPGGLLVGAAQYPEPCVGHGHTVISPPHQIGFCPAVWRFGECW